MKLYDHLEKFLGTVTQSFSLENRDLGVQVLEFHNTPTSRVKTYSTLGLSNHILCSKTGIEFRQEFIFAAYEEFNRRDIASVILSLCEYVLENHIAFLRGEIIGEKQLFPNVEANSLYISIPVFWDDEFHIFSESTPPTIFIWLLPIMSDEFHFIKTYGWSAFEDKLELTECDFWDLNRKSILNS